MENIIANQDLQSFTVKVETTRCHSINVHAQNKDEACSIALTALNEVEEYGSNPESVSIITTPVRNCPTADVTQS